MKSFMIGCLRIIKEFFIVSFVFLLFIFSLEIIFYVFCIIISLVFFPSADFKTRYFASFFCIFMFLVFDYVFRRVF
ncbi:MAG: hypothetical protein DBO98_04155 [Candidatus Liberibacter europaeus]|nr:hypothetical protein [Candidatus Liberibacter europaeus]